MSHTHTQTETNCRRSSRHESPLSIKSNISTQKSSMQFSPNSNSGPTPLSRTPEFHETTTSNSDEEVNILAASHPKRRAGRKKFKETRHPVYRGVRLRNSNKWVCELREPRHQKRVWLGTYPTPEMAARAHDLAALALRGSAACLNFADSVWRLPIPSSNDAKELRKAAAAAAEAFRPRGRGQDFVETRSEGGAALSGIYDICELSGVEGLAEAVLMSPPPLLGWRFSSDEVESDAEVELELWSF